MRRADTHLAACTIAAALLLAGANGAVAAADPADSAAGEKPSSTASDSGPDQSAHTSAGSTGVGSENARTVGDQPGQAAQDNSGDAKESPKESPKESGDQEIGKKPVDHDSGANGGPDRKTVNRVPVLLPEAPPPIDLPPALPATPADPDIVDAAVGGDGHHPDRNEPPVLTAPIVVAPPPIPPTPPMHILGGSVAPRVKPGEPTVKSTPQRGGEPAPPLRQASPSERLLREPPANVGLTARGQNPDRTGYTNEQVRRPLADMAVGALPGVAGIVMMTAAGICLGYRQAKMGQLLRIEGADRFLG
jgi:hypothetical protein